ncbi:hypothetical protein A2930_02610 [Candidatus Giovannonibacteria bacterium RIFCSPLOWO2_01_FULL_45_34]|uniref:Uncharacterized protein n=1 Tax=Candidatus Giovannonibacteria bacterium RIFCSPLOWO2_01_FULL_45_34 TaxID=1798351 RepID=A0A1F5X053_9BACT|nr:MAG: hypothetical protein A2930_02610 [Candidatus Giovannonibacteria bacterium RIFCSPLOWO2_01_FULL_45_34]
MVGTSTLNNVKFSSPATTTFAANASTTNFFIESGASTTAPSLLSVSGNYSNSGTFNDNSGTVYIASTTAPQYLSNTMTGDSAFNNLTILNNSGTDAETNPGIIFTAAASTTGTFTAITPSTKIRFKAGATTTLQNLTLDGQDSGTKITLRAATSTATAGGTQELAPTTVSGVSTYVSAAMVDADSVVIAFRDSTVAPFPGKFAIYNISGAQELAPTTFSGQLDVRYVSAVMADADSVVIAYLDFTNSLGKYAVYNISGAQELAPTTFSGTANVGWVSAAMVDANSVVIAYEDAALVGKFAIYNIDGTQELAPTTFSGSADVSYVSAAMVDADSVVIAYRDATNSPFPGKYAVYNISGAQELAPTTFSGAVSVTYASAAMVDADSVVIAYRDGTNSLGKYAVYNISGAQELAPTTFSVANNVNYASTAMADADSVVIAYLDFTDSLGKYAIYNISGAQELAPKIFSGSADVAYASAAMVDADSVAIAYQDATDSLGKYAVYTVGSPAVPTWGLEVPGTASITYTDVMDSNACKVAESNIDATGGTNTDSGGNACWTFASATAFTQRNYGWAVNDGSLTTAGLRNGVNGPITEVANGEVLRLRTDVAISTANLSGGAQAFTLQYKSFGGSCASGSYADIGGVGSGTIWRGYNTAAADNATLPNYLLDYNNVKQSFTEDGVSASNPGAVTVGSAGEWDWALQNNGATANTTYCFRMVKTDGGVALTYSAYPTLSTAESAATFAGGGGGGGGGAPAETPATGATNQGGGGGGTPTPTPSETPTTGGSGGGGGGGGGDAFLRNFRFFTSIWELFDPLFFLSLGRSPSVVDLRARLTGEALQKQTLLKAPAFGVNFVF